MTLADDGGGRLPKDRFREANEGKRHSSLGETGQPIGSHGGASLRLDSCQQKAFSLRSWQHK